MSILRQTDTWYRSAGGGDGALLTRCLLASMHAAGHDTGTSIDLDALLDDARAAHDEHVQVLALDLQARASVAAGDNGQGWRLLAAADTVARAAPHAVSEVDRVDAEKARNLLNDNR